MLETSRALFDGSKTAFTYVLFHVKQCRPRTRLTLGRHLRADGGPGSLRELPSRESTHLLEALLTFRVQLNIRSSSSVADVCANKAKFIPVQIFRLASFAFPWCRDREAMYRGHVSKPIYPNERSIHDFVDVEVLYS